MNVPLAQDLNRPPYLTIWNLSWPQVLMMVFHFLIGFVDTWAAGQIDYEIQASLGVIAQYLFLFLILATAVANGGMAAISQSLGAGKIIRAKRYVGLCLILAEIFGGIILVLGLSFKNLFLSTLQIPEAIRQVTEYFLFIYLLLLPFYYALITLNAVFRARKQVLFPLYSMAVVTLANTVGDLGLGMGWWGLPKLGLQGLAWTTFGSISLGAAVNMLALWKEGLLTRSTFFIPWRWTKRALPYLWKVGWPSVTSQVVWHFGYLLLYAITASLPHNNIIALAGMSSGSVLESLFFLQAFALNMTASIMVGHSLGAGRFQEARAHGYRILIIGLFIVIVMALATWQFLEPMAAFLAPNQAVAKEILNYLFWNLLAIPFTVTTMILTGAFNGAGAAALNMIIIGLVTWGLRLPLAYFLGHHIFKTASGIWISMFVSQALQSLILLYVFAFKDWSCHSIIKPKHCNDKDVAYGHYV